MTTQLTRERLAAALSVAARFDAAQLSIAKLIAELSSERHSDGSERMSEAARELESHSRIIDVSIHALSQLLKTKQL